MFTGGTSLFIVIITESGRLPFSNKIQFGSRLPIFKKVGGSHGLSQKLPWEPTKKRNVVRVREGLCRDIKIYEWTSPQQPFKN